MGTVDLVAGFECSGNRGPLHGLCGNGKWTGVPLKTVLDAAGVKAAAREFVFFGADHGEEEIEWRTQKFKLDQQFGRSLNREKALSAEPFLAWALNGEPLTKHQGSPLRLIVPGWYGVANVKWLAQIHVQEDAYLGKYQARWYRTLRGETIDGEVKWKETAVTHMNPKSFIARVTKNGASYKVLGVILNDGSPLKSVEVKVDEGPWQPATLDPTTKDKFGWKLFTYTWNGATPGEHALVSRVTEMNGKVQPTPADLEIEEVVPRRELAGHAKGHDCVGRGHTCANVSSPCSRYLCWWPASRLRRRPKNRPRPVAFHAWPTATPICRAPTTSAR